MPPGKPHKPVDWKTNLLTSISHIMEQKKFWQSSNFWTNIALFFGSLFIGFPAEAASETVYSVFSAIAGAGIVRNFLKDASPSIQQIKTKNFWAYLLSIVASIFPAIGAFPESFAQDLQQLTTALFNQNWQSAILQLIAVVNVVAHLLQKGGQAEREEIGRPSR